VSRLACTTSVKVGGNTLASYSYGANNGHLNTLSYSNGAYDEYTYDSLGRLSGVISNENEIVRYRYNTDNSLFTKTEDSVNEYYLYDASGRISEIIRTDANDLVYRMSVEYDEHDRVIGKADSAYVAGTVYSVDYHTEYNNEQNLSSYSYGFGLANGYGDGEISYIYNTLKLLSEKSIVDGSLEIKYNYTYVSRRADTDQELLLPDSIPLVEIYTSTVNGASLVEYEYTYDENGNIIGVYENGEQKLAYAYDTLGQLVREDNAYTDNSFVYTYDKNGNRTSKKMYAFSFGSLESLITSESYSYNTSGDNKDQLSSRGNISYSYDSAGNLISSTGSSTTTTYTWDRGRLLVGVSDSLDSYSYSYNSDGIRTRKVKQTEIRQ